MKNTWVDIEIGFKSSRVLMRQVKAETYAALRQWVQIGKGRAITFPAREAGDFVREEFTLARDSVEYIVRDDEDT